MLQSDFPIAFLTKSTHSFAHPNHISGQDKVMLTHLLRASQ